MKKIKKVSNVYGSYPQDEDKYKGQYLIIIGKKILAHSHSLKAILPIADKYCGKALITKVPTLGWKESMVL